jgi:hypothetical protein
MEMRAEFKAVRAEMKAGFDRVDSEKADKKDVNALKKRVTKLEKEIA